MWIFGYGSLIWRPGFPYVDTIDGTIDGWSRRFYQASPDHRGTPERPGRVVTLVRTPGARCWGRAFRIADTSADATPPDTDESGTGVAAILASLDHREKAGYERVELDVTATDGARVRAISWIAGPANRNFIGPAPVDVMASHIASARGPSGANLEYLLELAAALRAMGADDAHVFELERRVRAFVEHRPALRISSARRPGPGDPNPGEPN